MSADEVQQRLQGTGSPLRVLILDACRNDPFKGLRRDKAAGEVGLAPMAARGALVIYATAPGTKARDNVFTPVLVEEARKQRGAGFLDMLGAVTERVERETGGRQTPWFTGHLVGQFRLFQGDEPVAVVPGAAPGTLVPGLLAPRAPSARRQTCAPRTSCVRWRLQEMRGRRLCSPTHCLLRGKMDILTA